MEIFEKLSLFLKMANVRNAFIVGILISLCASILGVTLVLKRFSYIGDGLSHVAFGAMAVAGILGLTSNYILVLPVTVICAVMLLKSSQNAKIKGDAAVAMISVGGLAIGYLLINRFSTKANISADVCSTLFGATSILTLKTKDVIICVTLSAIVILAFLFFYNKIFCVTFDESFAKATGTKVGIYNLIISVIIAVIIVLAMNLVGSLLISALVIFPTISAMRVFKSFKSVVICSAVISVFSALTGLIFTVLVDNMPVGSTIVAVNVIVFIIFSACGAIIRGVKK